MSDILENIKQIIKDDDTVLVKGSHGMRLIEVVDFLKEVFITLEDKIYFLNANKMRKSQIKELYDKFL